MARNEFPQVVPHLVLGPALSEIGGDPNLRGQVPDPERDLVLCREPRRVETREIREILNRVVAESHVLRSHPYDLPVDLEER